MTTGSRILVLLAVLHTVSSNSDASADVSGSATADVDDANDPSNDQQTCSSADGSAAGTSTCRASQTSQLTAKSNVEECGIWLAPSSIPGAGLGMYAGRDFAPREPLQPSGEIVFPMIDINDHNFQRDEFVLLWDEYTWNGRGLWMDHEAYIEVKVASPGFGSAANSFIDLINVEELRPDQSIPNNIHRMKDPGSGAFSTYHNRQSIARSYISKGEELYVDYGQSWFRDRALLGPIPLLGDLEKATNLFRKWQSLRDSLAYVSEEIMIDLWKQFVFETEFDMSRVLGAFRKTQNEWEQLHQNMTLKEIRIQEGLRTDEWLREHGTCGDNMQEGVSTLRQAGRGAFATRKLIKDSIVAPLPLIHVSDRSMLDMFEFQNIRNKTTMQGILGEQLFVNYCMGHASSTLLLCPYGPLTSLINHNQTQVNVKVRWSDPTKGNHDPTLLERLIEHFANDKTAKLAMDLVALRDIEPGEELFLDYGDAWEKAWQEHVERWRPQPDAHKYVSAYQLNNSTDRLRTVFEQMANPYPDNVDLQCKGIFFKVIDWPLFLKTGTVNETDYHGSKWQPCEVLRSEEINGTLRYTAAYTVYDDNGKVEKHDKLTDAPREAFRFIDRPYTSDMFLPNAFRHPILVPDNMWPEYWENLF